MIIINSNKPAKPSTQSSVIALGNFDGVHLGHQAVIEKAVQIAQNLKAPAVVLTFEPHPKAFFLNQKSAFRITPSEDKSLLIERMGVDFLFQQKFDKSFAGKTARAFVNDYLVKMLDAKHVVIGYDFVFGQGRQGDAEFLKKHGLINGFDVTRVDEIKGCNGNIISSTKIRQYLSNGECLEAHNLLGRYWEIIAKVERGAQRGRTIGFPTANLPIGEYMHPRRGVYAVQVGINNKLTTSWHQGIANFGVRPTFDDTGVLLEIHLLGFSGDLYGKKLRIAFIEFIRPEQKFDGIESLKSQLSKDCIKAKRILETSIIRNNADINLKTP